MRGQFELDTIDAGLMAGLGEKDIRLKLNPGEHRRLIRLANAAGCMPGRIAKKLFLRAMTAAELQLA